jgi:hypothetical protein
MTGEHPAPKVLKGVSLRIEPGERIAVLTGDALIVLAFQALAHAGRPLPLKDLAARAGMSAAKAHPYLVSWCRVGLVAQDEGSGRYGLGPMAMHLGLISLQQHDPVRLASAQLEPLALATNSTPILPPAPVLFSTTTG